MGTIAQKLEYLNDTRLLLKDNINKINNVLDDNSTFRSYPQELFNGYIDILNNGTDTLWNNLEKVSASGEEATLENVETAPMKMVLNGNTSQDTTSGKNLIKIVGLSSKEEKTKTVNDVTFTVNDDGTVKVEGTNSGSSRILQMVTYESAITGEAGTYYYFANSPSQSKRLEMACFVDEKYEYPNSYGTTPWSKTATTNFTIRNIYFVINAGETVNNVYYVILTRDVNPQPYEPYTGGQPSPSPDFPQEVKVVKGENVVSVSGKNKFNIDDILIGTKINDRTFTATHVNGKLIEMDFNPNLKYNIGFKIRQDHESNGVFVRIMYTDGTNVTMTSTSTDTVSKTILTTKAIREILLQYSAYSTITTFEDFYIYEETSDTDYVPYSKTDYPINLGDIELCKINTYKDYFHKDSGKWYVHKERGKYEVLSENIVDVQDVFTNVKYFDFPKPTDDIARGNYNAVDIYYTCAKFASIYPFDTPQAINKILSAAAKNSYRVGFKKGTILAQAQEKLNGSVLYYVLKTPTEEEITNTTLIEQLEAIFKAKSVKDKTYITQTNDELPFILDVEAIKEYEVN